jgi:hypothetical protein
MFFVLSTSLADFPDMHFSEAQADSQFQVQLRLGVTGTTAVPA